MNIILSILCIPVGFYIICWGIVISIISCTFIKGYIKGIYSNEHNKI